MPTIEITTMIGCPLMCNVCPQDKLIKSYKGKKYLDLKDLQTILPKIPKHVRIDFSGMSEPWINNQCTDMFQYVLESGYDIAIYTTLVGMTITDTDRVINLIHKYINNIKILCIHLPDKLGNMRGWKYTEDYQYSLSRSLELKNLPFFQAMTMNKVYIHQLNVKELISILQALEAKEIEYIDMCATKVSDTKDILDIHVSTPQTSKKFDIKLVDWNINWLGHTRANSLSVTSKNNEIVYLHTDHENPVSCASTPFYDHNVLLPNGDVVLCCMDYSLKHIIGNLLTNDYDSLYLSSELIKIMKENKKITYSKCSICKSCDNAKIHNLTFNHWI